MPENSKADLRVGRPLIWLKCITLKTDCAKNHQHFYFLQMMQLGMKHILYVILFLNPTPLILDFEVFSLCINSIDLNNIDILSIFFFIFEVR